MSVQESELSGKAGRGSCYPDSHQRLLILAAHFCLLLLRASRSRAGLPAYLTNVL